MEQNLYNIAIVIFLIGTLILTSYRFYIVLPRLEARKKYAEDLACLYLENHVFYLNKIVDLNNKHFNSLDVEEFETDDPELFNILRSSSTIFLKLIRVIPFELDEYAEKESDFILFIHFENKQRAFHAAVRIAVKNKKLYTKGKHVYLAAAHWDYSNFEIDLDNVTFIGLEASKLISPTFDIPVLEFCLPNTDRLVERVVGPLICKIETYTEHAGHQSLVKAIVEKEDIISMFGFSVDSNRRLEAFNTQEFQSRVFKLTYWGRENDLCLYS